MMMAKSTKMNKLVKSLSVRMVSEKVEVFLASEIEVEKKMGSSR